MGVQIIEAEIRSGQYEVLLEAAKLVLTDESPVEIARKLRALLRAETAAIRLTTLRRCHLGHCLAQCCRCRLGHSYQQVRVVTQPAALLDEYPRGVAYRLRLLSYFVREDYAGVQMRAEAGGEVCMTTRTQVRSAAYQVRAELLLKEARSTRDALRDRVITAVSDEKSTLLQADIACSSAVEMKDLVTVERKGVVSRDGLTTLRAVGDSQCLNP